MADEQFAAPLFSTGGPNKFKESLSGVGSAVKSIASAFASLGKSAGADIANINKQLDQTIAKAQQAAKAVQGVKGVPTSSANSVLAGSGTGGTPGNTTGNGGAPGSVQQMLSYGAWGIPAGGGPGGGRAGFATFGGVGQGFANQGYGAASPQGMVTFGGSNGGSGMGASFFEPGFSGARLGVGVGLAGAAALGSAGNNLASTGTTWRQLELNTQLAMGGSQAAAGKYASQFTGWNGNVSDLMGAMQALNGSGGNAIGSRGFTSMMSQAGQLTMTSQALGTGMSLTQSAQLQQVLNSAQGRAAMTRMGIQLAPGSTNAFSVAETVSQRLGQGKMLSAKQVASQSAPGTGLYNTLGQMGFSAPEIQTMTGYLEAQQRTGDKWTLGAPNMTTAQAATAAKALGISGSDAVKQYATAEQAARVAQPAATAAADTSTTLNQAATNLAASAANLLDATGQLRKTFGGAAGGFGSASGALGMGSSLFQSYAMLRLLGMGKGGAGGAGGLGGLFGGGASADASAAALAGGGGASFLGGGSTGLLGIGGAGALAVGQMIAANSLMNNEKSHPKSWTAGVAGGIASAIDPGLSFAKGIGTFGKSIFGSLGFEKGLYGPQASGGTAVSDAEKFLGVPYKWGGTTPQGFDCSGLTQYVMREMGISIPRTSQQQAKAGTAVPSLAQAQPGDLVFYAGSDGTPSAPGHVGIYAGGGRMIDAPYTGVDVRFDPVGSPVAIRRFIGSVGGSPGSNVGASANNGGTGTSTGYMGNMPAMGTPGALGEGSLLSESATLPGYLTASMTGSSGTVGASNGGTQGNSASNGAAVTGSTALGGIVPTGQHLGLIQQALKLAGQPTTAANEAAVNTIVTHESSWNAGAINRWDSNAAAGHPSEGLMQTIMSTFQQYAIPGYNQSPLNPLDDLIAGIRYGVSRYGSLSNVPGVKSVAAGKSYVGYEAGSQFIEQTGLAMVHRGEMVIRSGAAAAMRMNQLSGTGGPGINVIFQKGSLVYNAAGGSGSTTSGAGSPGQADGEDFANKVCDVMEKRLSRDLVRSD